jgi:hypothetical protein
MNEQSRDGMHYHIKWIGAAEIDWESFGSPKEAEGRGRELARPGERFEVITRDLSCDRCQRFRPQAAQR